MWDGGGRREHSGVGGLSTLKEVQGFVNKSLDIVHTHLIDLLHIYWHNFTDTWYILPAACMTSSCSVYIKDNDLILATTRYDTIKSLILNFKFIGFSESYSN